MEEEEGFVYDEKRSCKICLLFTKFMFFIFHFVSLCLCFDYIEKRNIGYYTITILSICMCICNNIYYEYGYIKNYERRFASLETFMEWNQNRKMPRLTCSLECFETVTHSVFFVKSWSIGINPFENEKLILYRLSCLFLNLYTIILLFILCCACICVCSIDISSRIFSISYVNRSQQQPMNVCIDEQKECCICMDKNTQEWIETPCVHSFHRECLNGWIQTNRTCPICRSPL
jgi:hypothetical protein